MNTKTICILLCVFMSSFLVHAVDNSSWENIVLRPKMTDTPPKIDGVLDDACWKTSPTVNEPFIVGRPVYGEILPQKTVIWITYDKHNIYIAYYCYDDHPEKIRATLTKRDNILSEDWIDVDIDTMGTRQCTYEHACNPFGIQADLMNSVQGGESADPDWVWYSAGKIVKDGYIVELRIPFESLVYKSGDTVRMNLAFYRNVSNSGFNASWPVNDPKKGYFNCLVPIEFTNLASNLRLEALPSITYSNIWDRITPEDWKLDKSDKTNKPLQFGMGIKYGITSSSTAEVAYNPDFSQVETDQFQITANRRYPIFNSEKRPFFMEIHNRFNLAGMGENLGTAIDTRTITDPEWGAKFTGEFGKSSVGLLVSGDEWPGRHVDSAGNIVGGKNANFFIGRYRYNLGKDSYAGLFYSGREFGDEYNRVVAADMRLRVKGKHNFAFNTIYTFSGTPYEDTVIKTDSGAFTAIYSYYQKPLTMQFNVESFGKDFRMDTAYYLRTGITQYTGLVAPNFYPKWKGLGFIQKITTLFYGTYIHDLFTGLNDASAMVRLRFETLWQGAFSIQYSKNREYWYGEEFNLDKFSMSFGMQANKWLGLSASFSNSQSIYYSTDPFEGRTQTFSTSVNIQPSDKFTQYLSYTYQKFTRNLNGPEIPDYMKGRITIYSLNQLISRTTYQFNKYFFIRALLQFDSYRKIVLSDILASCTLIPGTVMHLGYGSLHEKQQWYDGRWVKSEIDPLLDYKYYQKRQSLFFKVSYLFRF